MDGSGLYCTTFFRQIVSLKTAEYTEINSIDPSVLSHDIPWRGEGCLYVHAFMELRAVMLACMPEKVKKLHAFTLWWRGIGFSGGLGGGGNPKDRIRQCGGGTAEWLTNLNISADSNLLFKYFSLWTRGQAGFYIWKNWGKKISCHCFFLNYFLFT